MCYIRGGDEPNDWGGNPEECTFVLPGIAGKMGRIEKYGPMWGDIDCGAKHFDWPKTNSRVIMVPICEGKVLIIEICDIF